MLADLVADLSLAAADVLRAQPSAERFGPAVEALRASVRIRFAVRFFSLACTARARPPRRVGVAQPHYRKPQTRNGQRRAALITN